MTDEALISPFTAKKISDLADKALRDADALGHFPTPVAEVSRAAGLTDVVSMDQLPATIRAAAPPAMEKVLGAVVFEERVAFVDRSTNLSRQRFTELHEASHVLLPWHKQAVLLDDKDRMSPDTRERIEAEANLGAAHLLFQNGRLHELAAEAGVGLRAALEVAPTFGASGHAALHYYAEHHPTEAVVLVVAGRIPKAHGLPVWRVVQSPPFAQRFSGMGPLLVNGCLPITPFSPLCECLSEAMNGNAGVQAVTLADRSGRGSACTAESWTNGRSIFVMVRAHARAARIAI